MMGRPAKTLEQKLNEGDAHKVGKRKLLEAVQNHAKSPQGEFQCPPDLDAYQKRAWNYTVDQLLQMNFDFGTADLANVKALAMAEGAADAARHEIRTLEREIKAKDKPPKNLAEYIRWAHEMERLDAKMEHWENKERKSWELWLRFSDRIGALHPMGRQKIPTMKSSVSDLASLLGADDEAVN